MSQGKKLSVKKTKEYKAIWLEALTKGNGFDYLARKVLENELEYSHIKIKWRYYIDEVWLDDEFLKEVRRVKYEIKMSIENELIKKCYDGDTSAIKFYLERLMSDKYMEKKSHQIKQNISIDKPIEINIIKPNGIKK